MEEYKTRMRNAGLEELLNSVEDTKNTSEQNYTPNRFKTDIYNTLHKLWVYLEDSPIYNKRQYQNEIENLLKEFNERMKQEDLEKLMVTVSFNDGILYFMTKMYKKIAILTSNIENQKKMEEGIVKREEATSKILNPYSIF